MFQHVYQVLNRKLSQFFFLIAILTMTAVDYFVNVATPKLTVSFPKNAELNQPKIWYSVPFGFYFVTHFVLLPIIKNTPLLDNEPNYT